MSWIYYNPNKRRDDAGDCTIRALTLALGVNWQEAYDELSDFGKVMWEMPSANLTWGEFLQSKGFEVIKIPNECPLCYTIKDFCRDNPKGLYVLGTGSHVVTIIDGDYYDTWDSGNKIPIYCFYRRR